MSREREMDIFARKLADIKIDADETWAIYGTGNGAELIYAALCKLSIERAVKSVIDRDEEVCADKRFHHIPIQKLSEVCMYLDGIIVAAMEHHKIICGRISNSLTKQQAEHIRVIDIFTYNTQEEQREYVEYIEKSILRESQEFVPFDERGYRAKDKDTKVIAWYLPQYHQIEINNKFHGQGFTEWTNSSRTIPMFTGHYQPHIPYDVGFYDLLNIDTFKRQIYLAKHYGIYGFCFHYYWFSGEKIMEKPVQLFLKHKELDMPFCFNWATENWTTMWDGKEANIMLGQKLKPEDDENFMVDILPYMKDSRYIKIDGKPILIIYRVDIFPQERVRQLLRNFREKAKGEGFPDLYIILTNSYGFSENVSEWGADAIVEFPVHGMGRLTDKFRPDGYLNPYFNGVIREVSSFIKNKRYMLEHVSRKYFRSALVSWDNTARKALSESIIYYGFNPETFKRWLTDIVIESRRIHSDSENLVFVNSWNEWAEGSHLEPDMKYGYAYLQAVKEVLEETGD